MTSYKKPALEGPKIRMLVKLIALFMLLMILSCGGIEKSGSGENLKAYQNLSELVNSREFEIENEWLLPLGGSMINLIGNPNYIRFKGDSVDVFLPYFGVRHSGGGYGSNGGIEYKGPAENLDIREDASKNNILVNFDGRDGNEKLEFFISLFQGGNATTSVTSSQRASISYRGTVKDFPEVKQ